MYLYKYIKNYVYIKLRSAYNYAQFIQLKIFDRSDGL